MVEDGFPAREKVLVLSCSSAAGLAGRSRNNPDASYHVEVQLLLFFLLGAVCGKG